MDESLGGSNALPPFLAQTYEMVDDPTSNTIVSWSSSNTSFVVWDPPEFAKTLLPTFFKHNNFSSFIRQLNTTYGFRKVDPEQWEFANDDFLRGQPHRMKNIHRRKPVHSHSVPNQGHGISSPLTEGLKREKEVLQLELEEKKGGREEFELHAQSLKQQLECIIQRQEKLLAQVLNKPGLVLSLTPTITSHERKRRLLTTDCLQGEAEIDRNRLRNSQVIGMEEAVSATMSSLITEPIDLMESSIAHWEEIIHQMAQTCAEDVYNIQTPPLAVILTEIDPPLEQAVTNSENRFYPMANSKENSLTFELDESQGYMNHVLSVQAAEVVQPTEKASESVNEARTTTIVPTGANDTFWEQFLTEHSGSSNVQDAQFEKKGSETKKQSDHSKLWWNIPSVNNLVEQMSHLTPAERCQYAHHTHQYCCG
uniref:HSF-type DNA-binding domain-containing protein n=1 Tax=Kalanchoe fedtschenkoi TaxID=63787 RepID=A0A7N0RDY9_KALFE